MAVLHTKSRPNGHTHKVGLSRGEAQCPYCGAPLTTAEYRKARQKLDSEEKARIATFEATFAAKARAEIDKARKEAAAQVAKAKREAAAGATAALAPRIAEAVNQEKQRSFADKLRLQEQLQAVQRKLEQRSSNSLGDEGEIDLYGAIRSEWSTDDMIVERIQKGRNGVDVIAHVLHQGHTVGRVAVDSKNVSRWSNRWIGKMAADLIQHKADFGIISSKVFRTDGSAQIDVIDGIIIAHPARVVTLIHLLRRQIIAMHMLRLGNAARDEKKEKLYTFLTSDPRAAQLLDRVASLSDSLVSLDEKERSTHLTVWNRRSELIKGIQNARSDFSTEIDQIVTGADIEASA